MSSLKNAFMRRATGIAAVAITILFIISISSVFAGKDDSSSRQNPANVISIEINNGAPSTSEQVVVIQVQVVGNPSHYMACEHPQFEGCEWMRMPMNGIIKFKLSEGGGLKKIYFRAKYLGRIGDTVVASINYQPQ